MTATTLAPDAPDAPPEADASTEHRWFVWGLVAIVIVGLVIRVVYIMTARQDFFDNFKVGGDPFKLGDAYLYQRGAVLLADGKGFINPYQYDILHIRQEDASHVPLFMLWLWIPAVLGFTGAQAAALWSAVLGGGTIIIVALAGREMVGPRVGLIAAAFAAVYPNVFSHDGFLQSETMAIFTVTLAVWMAYRYWHRPSAWNAVWVAAACTLAMLSRSELALLVPVLFLPLVLRTPATSWKDRIRWLVFGGVAVVLLAGPWVVFNLTRFDRPVTLSDNFGYTLLTATCDTTYYGQGIGYWDFACAEPTYQRIHAWKHDRSVNEVEFRSEALDYIKAHKGRVPIVVLARWARFTGVWDLAKGFDQVHKDEFVEGREAGIAWGGALMYYPLALLSIGGVVVLWRRRITILPVVAPFVVVWIAITLTFYMNRYRASAETCLCLLAAVAVDAVWTRLRRPSPASTPGAPGVEPAPPDPEVASAAVPE